MKRVKEINVSALEKLVKEVLVNVGEDPQRDGLKETPRRVAKSYNELLSGYYVNPASIIKLFNSNGYHELVTVANIEFYSLCEHHLLPFFGIAHIGYLPNGKVLGLSKCQVSLFLHKVSK